MTLYQNPLVMIAAGVALFVAVMAVVFGVDSLLVQRRNLSRRLKLQGELAPAGGGGEPQGIILEDDLLKRFADFVTPKDPGELAAGRKRMIQAGYRSPSALRVYNMAKVVAGLASSVGAIAIAILFFPDLSTPADALVGLVAGAIGFFAPVLWVERGVEKRREDAELGFPDMLDMLLICIEAGSGIDQACRRVAREVAGISPVLADELTVINTELWAGKDRTVVFRDFANRLGIADINAFATVLRQSDEFGVSIAESLRIYAADMRYKRVLRAEEKANTMPIKVALGSILFTMPPTLIVMAGPSLVTLMRTLGHH